MAKKIISAVVMPVGENDIEFKVGMGREMTVQEIKVEGDNDSVLSIKMCRPVGPNAKYGQNKDIVEWRSFFNIPFMIITNVE